MPCATSRCDDWGAGAGSTSLRIVDPGDTRIPRSPEGAGAGGTRLANLVLFSWIRELPGSSSCFPGARDYN
eukprot:2996677-Amphidinium_carterae.1